ncbi:hypothetical protein OH76DRAFT_1491170, partial [Lentinus brumalis]
MSTATKASKAGKNTKATKATKAAAVVGKTKDGAAGDAPRASGDISPAGRDELAAAPPLERMALMAEKQSKEMALKKEMAAARLGYATVNLLNPGVQLSFGQYNNRALNKKAVSDLVHSFRGMGIQHEDHPMPVAVKVDWVDPGCLVQNADDNELKAVRWTSKVQGAEVTVLGGQHRHAAVQGFKKQLEVEATKLQTALSKKQKKLNDIGDGGDVTRKGKAAVKKEAAGALRTELADMADKLATIKSLLGEIGTWTVELYDIDKLQEPTLRHLSMNKIDPQLSETMVERTWRWVYELKAAAAQLAKTHNVPVETLVPGHGWWSSRLLED